MIIMSEGELRKRLTYGDICWRDGSPKMDEIDKVLDEAKKDIWQVLQNADLQHVDIQKVIKNWFGE